MSNIKRYIAEHDWNSNCSVSLEVDHDILTHERAREINSFWSSDDYREAEAKGVVPAVIRLFGQRMMNQMLAEGGADFTAHNSEAGRIWSQQLRNEEGWGGEENDSPFGWCGIRVVAADVATVDFDDVEVRECKV